MPPGATLVNVKDPSASVVALGSCVHFRLLGHGVQPQRLGFLGEDHRHPVVDRLDEFVGRGGQDGAGPHVLALGGLPVLPQAGEREGHL